ncbi:MAG: hypothetical protein ACE5E5_08560 [Phycisphaerae bacterium]
MGSVTFLLALLAPLFGVPLTVITFYLRSIRDQHAAWRGECMRRMKAVESVAGQLERTVAGFQREFATKEEWLRESLQARADLRRLTEAVVRVETQFEQYEAVLRGFGVRGAHELSVGDWIARARERRSGRDGR